MRDYQPLVALVKDVLMVPAPTTKAVEAFEEFARHRAARVSDAVDDATQCLWGVAAIHDVHLSGHQARLLTQTAINAYTARMAEFERGER